MENIRPCNEGNAIKVAAFAFEFEKEINEKILFDIINHYKSDDQFRLKFNDKKEHYGTSVQINNNVQQVLNNVIMAVELQCQNKEGELTWSLQLRRNALVITCYKYTRWDNVISEVLAIVDSIFEFIKNESIRIIAIEYLDEFNILNNSSDWKKELFKEESKYLTQNIFETKDLWHIHQGFFNYITEPLEFRLLSILEIEHQKIVETDTEILFIKTQQKSEFKEIKILDELKDDLKSIFETNHSKDKEILSELLSNTILNEINLKVD